MGQSLEETRLKLPESSFGGVTQNVLNFLGNEL